jgi:hypothetical protein
MECRREFDQNHQIEKWTCFCVYLHDYLINFPSRLESIERNLHRSSSPEQWGFSQLFGHKTEKFLWRPTSIYAYAATCLCTWRRGGTATRRNESLEWPLLLLVGCLKTVGAWNVENLQINNNKLNNNCNYNDTNVFMVCFESLIWLLMFTIRIGN